MKLAYLTWGYSHDDAIIRAFESTGLTVGRISLPLEQNMQEAAVTLKERIQALAGDIVFSVNFFSWVSELCQREAIPYCCWILQLPNFDLYTAMVLNPCNYLGICDSYLVEKLWGMGIEKAFFLPDAVEMEIGEESIEGDKRLVPPSCPVEREACFIARHPKQALSTDGMTLYGKGYLDAFLHFQRVLYGASILENGLLQRIQGEFLSHNPIPGTILPDLRKLYMADYYLAPVCTAIQQDVFLQNFASILTIYSDGDFPTCKSEKHPYVEEEEMRREIMSKKEFTLVLAPHTLHNGIPRIALEAIASGGFPICGFQRDYAYFFKKDETMAYFANQVEFQRSVMRYGNNPEERERVRNAAFQTVAKGHTYFHRISVMLEMWRKL